MAHIPNRPRWNRGRARGAGRRIDRIRLWPSVEAMERRLVLFSNGSLPFGILGPPIHEEITHVALDAILRPEVVDAIIGNGSLDPYTTTGNVGVDVRDVSKIYTGIGPTNYDPGHHFDGSAFAEGSSFINVNYRQFINDVASNHSFTDFGVGSLTDIFGKVTHTVQDFYAHTNWVESVPGSVLVDDGDGFWSPMTPYSEVDGVVLAEGPPPAGVSIGHHDQNYAALLDPDFLVDVHINGHTVHGIVSGSFGANTTYTPAAAAVSHDDPTKTVVYTDPLTRIRYHLTVPSGTGLNKDRPDRLNFDRAEPLAVLQTTHEFIRLLHLVADPADGGGPGALDRLLCAWVKPEAMGAVEAMIGDITTTPPAPGPVTIQYYDPPVPIPLGDCVRKGDAINVQATLFSTDPNDDAEGEPLIIYATGPDGKTEVGQLLNIGTHNQPYGPNLVAQVDGEELFAYIQDGEGDEHAVVSAMDSSTPPDFLTADQSNAIAPGSTQLNLASVLMAADANSSTGTNVTIQSSPTGDAVDVSGPSLGSADVAAAGFGVLAALQLQESVAINSLAIGQPDTAYTAVAQPTTAVFTLAAPTAAPAIRATGSVRAAATPGVDPGLLAAFNSLLLNTSQVIGVAGALRTATDRDGSARAAGDGGSQTRQELAIRQFAPQLAALLGQQPALRTQLQASLRSLGITPTLSGASVNAFERSVARSGLPDRIVQILKLSGAGGATIDTIKQLVIVQDSGAAAGDLAAKLTDTPLLDSLRGASTALAASGATDLSVSVTGAAGAVAGSQVGYDITVTNNGLLAVGGASLTDVFDQALSGVSWETTGVGGRASPASGSGAIRALVSVPAGGSVSFTVMATLSPLATGTLSDDAMVVPPAGVTDPNPANDASTAVTTALANPNLRPPLLDAIASRTVLAGSPVTIQPLATDPNSLRQILRFSLDPGSPAGAMIDPITGLVTWTPTGGPRTVPFTVRVTEDGSPGLSAARTFSIAVANVAPTVSVGPDAAAVSGAAFTRGGSYRDRNAAVSVSATVDYGDGSPARPLALKRDGTFTLDHSYARPGVFTVTVRVRDQYGNSASGHLAVSVTAPHLTPTVSVGPDAAAVSGAAFTRGGSYRDRNAAASVSATVDYGDGSPARPLALKRDGTFTLDHSYARPGVFTVTVRVRDQYGNSASGHLAVSVTAPPPGGPLASGFGRDRDAFVATLYRELLGRAPEPQGLDFWSGRLAAGVRPLAVAVAIVTSAEHRELVSLNLVPRISLRRAFADALSAGKEAAR